MNNHYVYVTSPKTETIHLVHFFSAYEFNDTHTLCGQSANELVEGDETLSGVAATCGRCRASARLPRKIST